MVKRYLFCALLIAVFIVCSEDSPVEDCSTLNNEGIELVYPKGNETFKIGDNVAVKWKVDPDVVNNVDVKVSTTSSQGPFVSIYKKGVAVPYEGGIQCMDSIWVVGSEHNAIGYNPPQTVYFKVESYQDDTYNDVSGMITINEN